MANITSTLFIDRVYDGGLTYNIKDSKGAIVYANVSIEQITAILTQGTALNKQTMDKVVNDLNTLNTAKVEVSEFNIFVAKKANLSQPNFVEDVITEAVNNDATKVNSISLSIKDVPIIVRTDKNNMKNLFIGGGGKYTTGNSNTALGNDTLLNNTTGNYNTAVGSRALSGNTTGDSNTAVGSRALSGNTTGNYNVAVGNNALSGNTTGNYNVAVGNNALLKNTTGNYNVVVGYQTLFNNTTGIYNTALGNNALFYNTTGGRNTALGNNALDSNTTGNYNTAVGNSALSGNTTGIYNTAVGDNALSGNTTGNNNTAVGESILSGNTTGNYNVAVGNNALLKNTTGNNNTTLGYQTLFNNTTGDNNVAVGSRALSGNTTGNNNTAVGNNTNIMTDNVINVSIIGYNAIGNESNSIVLGNNEITKLSCQVTTITALSDSRTKEYHEHANLDMCYQAVKDLPVSRYKYKKFTGTHIDENVTGFMADDVEKVFPKSVSKSNQYFSILDEKGEKTYEDVEETITKKTINEKGEEVETTKKVTKKVEKMFLMEDVKDITMTEAIPTLWGAVQSLMKKIEELEEWKKNLTK